MFICTTLLRIDEDENTEELDVVIEFHTTHFAKGYPATRVDPAAPNEYEFTIDSIEFDYYGLDMPSPLTSAEREQLEKWFYDNHEKAVEIAEDHAPYEDYEE